MNGDPRLGPVDGNPRKGELKPGGGIIGARPIIGGQAPDGPQPAPVGTGTATSQTIAPHDDTTSASASLRIREVLHITPRLCGEWVEPGMIRLGPTAGRERCGWADETRCFGLGVCEPLRDRVLGVAILGLLPSQSNGRRRSQADGREHIRRLGAGEGQIPVDRWNAQITSFSSTIYKTEGSGDVLSEHLDTTLCLTPAMPTITLGKIKKGCATSFARKIG
jgi:hypothetical protein